MSRQRPSNVPAARNALVRFQRQRLQGFLYPGSAPAASWQRPGSIPAAPRQREHARTNEYERASNKSFGQSNSLQCFVRAALRAHAFSFREFGSAQATSRQRPGSVSVPRQCPAAPATVALQVLLLCDPSIQPASQRASRLKHDFLNFSSCSKTASLFIVFFIQFAFLAQRARGTFLQRSTVSGRVWACLGVSGRVWVCLGVSGRI